MRSDYIRLWGMCHRQSLSGGWCNPKLLNWLSHNRGSLHDANIGDGGFWTLVRYNANGTLDSSFGSGGIVVHDFSPSFFAEWVLDVGLQASGKIVTAGRVDSTWGVARFNANGTIDTTFSCDGKVTTDLNQWREQANALVIQPDQKIVVAGETRTCLSCIVHAVARYDGSDIPPPLSPTNLKAKAVPTNQINLTWQDNANDEAGFKIERKTGAGGTYSEIATVGANVTSYSDMTGLSANTEYFYQVRAYNAIGSSCNSTNYETNTGCTGAEESFETGNFSQFPWVTGCNANWTVSNLVNNISGPHTGTYYAVTGSIGNGQVTYLEVTRTVEAGSICFYPRLWTNTNETFLRFLLDGDFVQAWTGVIQPYTFASMSIPAGTHTFRWELVKTTNTDPSGVAMLDDITFPPSGPPPSAPTNLSATAISSSQINLTWQDNSTNETGFKIERKTGMSGTYAQIATVGAGVTTYSNTGLSGNTQYCYRVRATNDGGDSAYSNESCATTLPPPPDAKFRVERSTGNVLADGSYNCGQGSPGPVNPPAPPCFNSGIGADLAEYINASEALDYGDVVEPDSSKPKYYRKVRTPYSTGIAGVISTQPGMTMAIAPDRPVLEVSQDSLLIFDGVSAQLRDVLTSNTISLVLSLRLSVLTDGAPQSEGLSVSVSQLLKQRTAAPRLALIGRVPVKVTAENGPIRTGDLLVSASLPGYAMRCADAIQCEGAIIGKALEPLEHGTGVILMLIMR